jgi:hypothetical protein
MDLIEQTEIKNLKYWIEKFKVIKEKIEKGFDEIVNEPEKSKVLPLPK